MKTIRYALSFRTRAYCKSAMYCDILSEKAKKSRCKEKKKNSNNSNNNIKRRKNPSYTRGICYVI